MKIVHISDTHGKHWNVQVPECDVVVFTGDAGTRTDIKELTHFLIWFEQLPAREKIMIAGNHDICLDKRWVAKKEKMGYIEGLLATQQYHDAKQLIEAYNIKYLEEKEYVFEGVKFFGSPYSPSFNRDNWVFNADRGQEIKTHWGLIPSDVDVLLTHTPPYQILDWVDDRLKKHPAEDQNVGCKDLLEVMRKRLTKLKLHCFGHIHDNSGVVIKDISQTRKAIFSNGACVDNWYKPVITKPFIIEI